MMIGSTQQRLRSRILTSTLLALGTTLTMTATAAGITLSVSVENLGPVNGHDFTPLWFGFHDGSFDLFDVGSSASIGIENLAEDGITGLEGTQPAFVGTAIANGLDPSILPPVDATLSGAFAQANNGTQGLLVPSEGVAFTPGAVNTTLFDLNGDATSNRFFSYASMFLPSNDAFFANDDPTAVEIFDSAGNFIGADFIVWGRDILDAGTEVNDELLANIPIAFDALLQGLSENGTITVHPGLQSAGSGGALDFSNGLFADADFTVPGYQIARISVTQAPAVPEPSHGLGSLIALGGLFIVRRWRR